MITAPDQPVVRSGAPVALPAPSPARLSPPVLGRDLLGGPAVLRRRLGKDIPDSTSPTLCLKLRAAKGGVRLAATAGNEALYRHTRCLHAPYRPVAPALPDRSRHL